MGWEYTVNAPAIGGDSTLCHFSPRETEDIIALESAKVGPLSVYSNVKM